MLPGAVWNGLPEEDAGADAGAMEEHKEGEAASESPSQNESGLVSDYSKVGTGTADRALEAVARSALATDYNDTTDKRCVA